MASNTENLNLLMKNPSTDGADTFNVQTMLNENWQKIDNNAGTVAQTLANILKPTTPPLIGLPPSTTPDGMFQALGNTGELHVWRKTMVTAQEIPAGYTLGSAEANVVIAEINNGYGNYDVTIAYGTSVSVSDAGIASNSGTTSSNTLGILTWGDGSNRVNALRGKFCKVYSGQGTVENRLFYVPNNATLTYKTVGVNNRLILSSLQPVNAYPLTPAGTTTTYPVSTNPNAYQEGDDAKEAGYTLGEVKSGKFRVSSSYVQGTTYWKYGTSLTVSDDGTVNIANPSSVSLSGSSSSVASDAQQMAGKYAVCTSVSDAGYEPDFPIGTVVFFPSDTLFTRLDGSCWASKYQPVTGYPAIPAGTTIEYLGKLVDKARVQVVSYVGTGTYESSNPNSLTFDFVPKLLFIKNVVNDAYYICLTLFGTTLTDTYENYAFFDAAGNMTYPDSSYARRNGKKIQWYSRRNAYVQANGSGYKYTAIAIG